VPGSALTLSADDLATLRSPIPRRDAQELLAAAEALVPHPSDAFDWRQAWNAVQTGG
jgi:hypothetical protein